MTGSLEWLTVSFRRRGCRVGLALAALVATSCAAGAETVITVRASGPAAAIPGDVATLDAALIRARALRREAPDSGGAIVIELAPGVHRLSAPVTLTREDSGTPARPLVIRSRPGRRAIISGGLPLASIAPPAALVTSYPAVARPHLRFFSLPIPARDAPYALVARRYDRSSGPAPFEIFDDNGPLTPARWPNGDWAMGQPIAAPVGQALLARGWRGDAAGDIWLHGFLKHDWCYEVIRISQIDGATSSLSLAAPPLFGLASRFRFAILHSRGDLDEAGEWHRDETSRILAVWPREGGGSLTVSHASGLLVLDQVRYLRLQGLVLEHARGDAIFARGGSNIEITGVVIRNVGGRAVAFEGAEASFVTASHITDTGDGGVILSSGDRTSLKPGGLSVRDTVIERFARLGLSHRPAVSLHGVGHSVVGNAIADGPHTAIDFTGNDHTIRRNEIARVVRESGDAGAIYTGRDWTARGTVISENFLHDIRAGRDREVKGVYLDDLASGTSIHRNVFLRVDQPVFIGGGRDNEVTDNLFIASSPGVHLDGRALTWARDLLASNGPLRQRLAAMPIISEAWRRRYPTLGRTLEDEPAVPKRNVARRNIFLSTTPYRLLPEVSPSLQSFENATVLPAPAGVMDAAHARDLAAPLGAMVPRGLAIPFDEIDRRLRLGPADQP